MKKQLKIIAQLILTAALVFAACKKKEEAKTTDPTPAPAPTPAVNPLTATVNGNAFTTYYMNNYNTYSIATGKNFGLMYYFMAGKTDNPYLEGISFNLKYGVGTYTLSSISSSDYKAFYKSKYSGGADTVYTFNVNTGTINISQFDTLTNGINKLKATFSFTTQNAKNVTYTVTNGVIDYTK